MNDVVNLAEKFALFNETWTPKIIGAVDDFHVKIARVEGEFVWHSHADADELFLIVDGQLRLKLKDRDDVLLGPGELFVVPRGLEHLPVGEPEAQILMIERQGTVNTGGTGGERMVAEPEWI